MTRIYRNILVLTGAGISAESGLATFRSSNGLWNNHRVEDVASIEGFERNPALVHDFYNELKVEVQQAQPNRAHLALTKLQQEYPAEINIVTQNVDTLHEKAGNKARKPSPLWFDGLWDYPAARGSRLCRDRIYCLSGEFGPSGPGDGFLLLWDFSAYQSLFPFADAGAPAP